MKSQVVASGTTPCKVKLKRGAGYFKGADYRLVVDNRAPSDGIDAPVYAEDGKTRLAGTAFRAQLYAGPTAGSLRAVGSSTTFRTNAAAGYIVVPSRAVVEIPTVQGGSRASIEMRAWESAGGTTFEEAEAQGAKVGRSAIFTVVTGNAGSPPSLPVPLKGLQSFRIGVETVRPDCIAYTLNAHFEKGALVGLVATNDQLELTRESVTLPFLWVPNSNDSEGTVSKIDTRTGRELGRHHTGPGPNGDPSRTTVDQQGNCWVANRHTATVVKIGLFENGQYVHRNDNGTTETSQDLDGDGNITGKEILPWGQDECVLLEVVLVRGREDTFVPGTYQGVYGNDSWNPGPRGIAVDARGNVWIGTYGTKMFYYLDGTTARIQRTLDVSSVNHTDYGAVIDAHGILWSSGQNKNQVLRLNPADNSFRAVPVGHFVYGLGVDKKDHLFVSGWEESKLSRLNVATGVKDWTVSGGSESRGVAVTDDGDVWVANSGAGTVTRWSNNGTVKATISVGSTPTGVAVDAAGKVWVVNFGDENIHRIDPTRNAIDLSKRMRHALRL